LEQDIRSALNLRAIEDAKEAIWDIKDSEQEYFNNMPESLQSSGKGSAAEEAINQFEEVQSFLDDFPDMLDAAIDKIGEAVGRLNEAMGG
jgi:hypothetical protein